jgi:cytochrome c-type biogenesis protein CcmE
MLSFKSQIVFFYSPSELKSIKEMGREIRIGGLIKENTIKKIDALTSEFVITDLSQEVKVTYSGILPDLFREKQGIVAKGSFNFDKNKFYAKNLLVKHDEKYMPPEVAKSLGEEKRNNYDKSEAVATRPIKK